jgi:hypothetical protein
MPRVARSFPGEGDHRNPAELNNVAARNVRIVAEPHTRFRIQHGLDVDPAAGALDLGYPWRPSPDSPAARRPGG